MPRNRVVDMSDEENEPEAPPPKKARKDVADNVELPNRTRGVSARTVSVKQQAISECFFPLRPICSIS